MSHSKKSFSMRAALIFFSIISLTVMTIGILPVHGEEKIYDDVLRLHVIANSDSKEDQELKLKVRDSVLATVAEMLKDTEEFEDALAIISRPENLDTIKAVAAKTVFDEGYDYTVTVTVGEEHYPRKNYESLAFPSGTYTSLRVELGESDGQNWWCVLFPRLCLGAASDGNEDCFIQAGFTPEQYKTVTDTNEPRYEVKFKILEIISSLSEGQ